MSIFSRFLDGVRTLGLGVTLQAALYPYRKAYYSARFSPLSRRIGRGNQGEGTDWTFPGRVLAHRQDGPQQVEMICENALVRLTILATDLVRVRISPSGHFVEPFSYAVAKPDDQWPPVPFTVEETDETLLICTKKLYIEIAKTSLNIAFIDPDGTVIHADEAGVGWDGEKMTCRKHLPTGEYIYGLGQKTTPLNKRGLALEMWNTDPQFYHPGHDPIYSNIPFYLGLHNGYGYGILLDTPARGRFDLGLTTHGIARLEAAWQVGDEIRTYFFYGPKLVDVLNRYTELTGRMIMPPLWALGYHQNRWSYFPESRVRQVAREFRTRQIPCEAIHLDIDYMDGYRCFTWDPKRFPDPARLIADLHVEGFKVVAMVDPGIKADRKYWVCKEGLKNDMFCKYPNGRPYSGPVWPGECYFPDFTSPRVREWWGELYRGMVNLGIDGFWNDMNEPTILGQQGDTFPDIVQHDYDGHPTDHRTAHNVYGMQMARASVEGLTHLRPHERPLLISRSVWAGSQRYNMHWLGDNFSDWDSLRNTMQLTMNMGLSGMAFTGPDTGGLAGNCNGELLIRWNQMSVFTPFFRNHSAKNTADQEPWAFGEDCERISREYIELRYRLLPYLYTAFWQSAQSGLPIMRPLFLTFQDDAHTYDMDDEFMCGDAFLVAPVYKPGVTSRRLYIPSGRWYDFWNNTLIGGPQIACLDAPLDRIPLLIRAGSIVPMWPTMQHTGEYPVDTLILHVYPGNNTSWLYEDDGHTWNFQGGSYRLTRLSCKLDGSAQSPSQIEITLSIDQPDPRTTGLPIYRRIQVHLHGMPAQPARICADNRPIVEAVYDPEKRTLTFETGLFYTIEANLK